MRKFDHLALSCTALAEGADAVGGALGVPLEAGGKHPAMGTHNRLLSLGPGEYLEVIAIDPDAPLPGRPRWFRLDNFRGPARMTNWVARVDDLDAELGAAPEGAGRATDLQRGDLRWRMGVPDDGCLPFDEVFPGLIQWQGDQHPAARLPDRGCRLLAMTLSHPDPAGLAAALRLDDPRITVVEGKPGLAATIRTPAGDRRL